MTTNFTPFAITSLLVAFASNAVAAEQTLTFRGGLTSSPSEYPYAYDDTGPTPIEAEFGHGGFAYAAYANNGMFGVSIKGTPSILV